MKPYNDRFTKRDWDLTNNIRFKSIEEQQKIAEQILGECERIREETDERTKTNYEITDKRIFERINDIEFNASELQVHRKEIYLELEELKICKNRILHCLKGLEEDAFNQCKECLQLRENRIGIDLIVDEVELALQYEMKVILHWKDRLKEAMEKIDESMRRLRAAQYALDSDLEMKEYSALIDRKGANLKPTNLDLAICDSRNIRDPAVISKDEWEIFTAKNIQNAIKEVYLSRPNRVMVDSFLKQAMEDTRTACINCNQAFKNRIAETRNVKQKLEKLLSETVIKIEAMTNNINMIEKALNEKMPYMALTCARQENRAKRPGVELVKDAVSQSLYLESEWLNVSTQQLLKALEEAEASLRYLKQAQINIEEDIKVKTNSLKIDEMQCTTVRETMKQRLY